jgi:hypothetical protein
MEGCDMPEEYAVILDGSPEDLLDALSDAAAQLWLEDKNDK